VGRIQGVVCSVALAVAFVSCGGGGSSSSNPTPTAPTPTPTVTSITVTAPATSAKPGDTAQFTATAAMSNNTTQTVTNQASWQSSDTARATVSTSGMVTAVAAGEVDIHATYSGMQGSAHITITAPAPTGFSICGTVKDQGSSTTLPGATVIVKDTSFTTTSDASGKYCFSGVSNGRYVLRATRSAYTLTEVNVTISGGNVTVDISMPSGSSPAPSPSPSPAPSPACCKICTTGQPCGDTCISKSDTCHVGPGCACQGIAPQPIVPKVEACVWPSLTAETAAADCTPVPVARGGDQR
jgi:hypothetical protein